MVGDAEAVGFVAHLLNEAQTFAVFVEIEGYGVVGEENLFEAFGDADDGNLQLQVAQGFAGGAELPFSTVDDDKVGQRLALFGEAFVATVDRFVHRCEIIGAFDCFYVEVTVVFFRWFRFLEDHARRYRQGALYVGVVEALDVHGQVVEPEIFLCPRQYAGDALLGIELLGAFYLVELVLLDVLFRDFEQFAFVAPLGHGEEGLPEFRFGQERHDDFARLAFEATAQFGNGQRQYFFLAFVEPFPVFDGVALYDGTVAHMQVIDVGVVVVFGVGENVDIVYGAAHDDRFGFVFFEQEVFFFELLRFFKFELLGQCVHLFFEMLGQLLYVAVENLPYLFDVSQVVGFALHAFAGAFAIFDVVLQTHLVFVAFDVFGRELVRAGAHGIERPDEFDDGACQLHVGVGTVVFRAVVYDLAGEEDPWKGLVPYRNPGIGLVVFEQDVVARLVLLDEAVFEVKGVFFAAYDGVFDVADVAHQHGGAQRFVGFVEVGTDASFQVLGFAHIDDVPFFVEVLVYSGRIGEE